MFALTRAAHEAMLAHCIDGLPNEACGLFAGADGSSTVSAFYPMSNVAKSSQIYQLDGREMLDVEALADGSGLQVMGVMHSHTHTTAFPSPTDVADAARFDPFGAWYFVIVSLKHADPALRCYRISDGEISEARVDLVEDG